MKEPHFYKAQEIYGENFLQLPKVLFTNSKYISLSNDAKVAYALLKDRFNYSIKNNWIDEEDNIYFIFTNNELMKLLLCGNKKTVRIKKELEQVGLLFQKRMGLNKPNRLYLLRPEVTATDVHKQINAENVDNSGSVKTTLPENVDNSGSVKTTLPVTATNTSAETLDNSGSVKTTHNLYKEYNLDTNRYNNTDTKKPSDFKTTTNLKFPQEKVIAQNQDLLKNAATFLTDPDTGKHFLNQENIRLLQLWSNDPKDFRHFCTIVLNAKNAVIKEHEEFNEIPSLLYMNSEEKVLQELIGNVVRSCFNYVRSGKEIKKSFDSFMFVSLRNALETYAAKELVKLNKEKAALER
ncbi:replication initiator protein A [Liquorilactobacillus vini]|uniref:replication initiator protein A n=2 Tax=Liquorilactobacillus vini TaxID=238015 RepID=UPI00029B39AD|nr:replication initiator protein A [Liquorilactobacillus vini]